MAPPTCSYFSRQEQVGRHAEAPHESLQVIECEFAFPAQDHRAQGSVNIQQLACLDAV
jgi:hypothetical protein